MVIYLGRVKTEGKNFINTLKKIKKMKKCLTNKSLSDKMVKRVWRDIEVVITRRS